MGREDFNPQVGELVRFRQWDDMKAEFGLNSLGSINCRFGFLEYMRHLCGREFEITDVDYGGRVYGHDTICDVSVDMLEPVADEPEEDYDTEELCAFLNSIKVV